MSTLVDYFCQTFKSVVEDPRFDNLRKRQARQGMVLVYVGLALAVPGATWTTGSQITSMMLLLPLMIIAIMIGVSVRGIADLPGRALDEFQLELRNRAFTRAYWYCAVIGLGGGMLAGSMWSEDKIMGYAVFLMVIMLISAMPALALAWAMPDEDQDDD
jgi:hypothetical protein